MKITTKPTAKYSEALLHAKISEKVKAAFAEGKFTEQDAPGKVAPRTAPAAPAKPPATLNKSLKFKIAVIQSKKRLLSAVKAKPDPMQALFKAMDAKRESRAHGNKPTSTRPRAHTREAFKDFNWTPLKNNQKKSMQ